METGVYRHVLTVKPDHPAAHKEVEFEVDILRRGGEDDILAGEPVEGASVYFAYRRSGPERAGGHERHKAQAEPSGGVYGHYHEFRYDGSCVVEISGTTKDGKNLQASFASDVAAENEDHR